MRVQRIVQIIDRIRTKPTVSGISSSVERVLWEHDVGGSIPSSPTIRWRSRKRDGVIPLSLAKAGFT